MPRFDRGFFKKTGEPAPFFRRRKGAFSWMTSWRLILLRLWSALIRGSLKVYRGENLLSAFLQGTSGKTDAGKNGRDRARSSRGADDDNGRGQKWTRVTEIPSGTGAQDGAGCVLSCLKPACA